MLTYDSINPDITKPIPAGYCLQITSWENDADNFNTVSLYGLTLEDAKFYLSFVSQFKSQYMPDANSENNFGNSDVSFEKEKTALEYALKNYPPSSPDLVEDFSKEGSYEDLACELIGIWNEGELYRVFDSYNLFYIPQDCPRLKIEV